VRGELRRETDEYQRLKSLVTWRGITERLISKKVVWNHEGERIAFVYQLSERPLVGDHNVRANFAEPAGLLSEESRPGLPLAKVCGYSPVTLSTT
jgi:hypothetical protein